MISFVVPAHNEQTCLGRTLQAIHDAARDIGRPYEVIVVDDASTDATADVAREAGAVVVSVNHRQIAATRNAGGRAARGERLFFVDADTVINRRVVASALRHLDRGAAGGGAPARFEGPVPLYAHLLMWWLGLLMRLGGMTGGAFMFCTRDAFKATGGFDERLFGAEDAAMCWALKREGRFVVLWRTVLTSGRRVRGTKGIRMLAGLFRMGIMPRILKDRSSVEKIWYQSDRDDDDRLIDSVAVQVVNAAMLLFTLAVITGPLWELVPWSVTPRSSMIGQVRIAVAIVSCHVALVLWPCAYFLLRAFFRQRRWIERAKVIALFALCVWLAWGGTEVVVQFWLGLFV
jgi:cellulose synthase/poly-beta-1,6-N-acetylglucosamine synthase-like glycosyltransferase